MQLISCLQMSEFTDVDIEDFFCKDVPDFRIDFRELSFEWDWIISISKLNNYKKKLKKIHEMNKTGCLDQLTLD